MDFPIEMTRPPGECYIVEHSVGRADSFVMEADSYGAAKAWIDDVHDRQERAGAPLSRFGVYPIKISPGGRDLR